MIVGVIFFVGVLESGVFGLRDNIQRHRRWWTEVVEPYHKRGPRAFIGEPYRATNQSLTAAAFRYLTHTDTCTGAPSYVNIVQWDDATVRKIGKIAGMVLLIGLLFLWWGKGISQSPIVRGAEFSTALIAMLELSEVSLLTHHVVLLVPFAVELVYLAAWQPPLATRPSPLAPRPIRVIAGGMAISFLFLGLCVIPTFKALSFFFFATMVQLAILVFLILRLRANDDGKVPGTL
jgi:hypothetical protein